MGSRPRGQRRLTATFQPPPALRPQDRVAVIAPASGFERGAFEAGLALLSARYRAEYRGGLFERQRYLAGSDARRLAGLHVALARPGLRGGVCGPGGCRGPRLLASVS